MIPYWKISILFQNIHDHIDSRFVFKFHENRPPGSGWNDVLFCWQKVSKVQFSPPFSLRPFGGAEGTKSLQGACPVSRRLRVKFRFNLFWLAEPIGTKKWFCTTMHNVCFQHTKLLTIKFTVLSVRRIMMLRASNVPASCGDAKTELLYGL